MLYGKKVLILRKMILEVKGALFPIGLGLKSRKTPSYVKIAVKVLMSLQISNQGILSVPGIAGYK